MIGKAVNKFKNFQELVQVLKSQNIHLRCVYNSDQT